MWYMHCGPKGTRCRSEMNVQAAWNRGYTGKNVVVTILDDGIEKNHPDLAGNYVSPPWEGACWSLSKHGTGWHSVGPLIRGFYFGGKY
ncbi:proprotein convertase subtilisin/kexin type 6-like, partial [Sturnira hondurensis]|uniref:proprotein convertase subtilisin/kexin type 6-like n=1 Tax=Sturnira hondurensis TaxID=192404 RepID=UPI00187A6436